MRILCKRCKTTITTNNEETPVIESEHCTMCVRLKTLPDGIGDENVFGKMEIKKLKD